MVYKDIEKKRIAQRRYYKKWYYSSDENRKKVIERVGEWRENPINHKKNLDSSRKHEAKLTMRAREFIKNSLEKHGKKYCCEVCGESRWYVLDFHHINPLNKSFDLAPANSHSHRRTEEEIELELKKCRVLCSNCHRELHYIERKEKIDSSQTTTSGD